MFAGSFIKFKSCHDIEGGWSANLWNDRHVMRCWKSLAKSSAACVSPGHYVAFGACYKDKRDRTATTPPATNGR